MYIWVLHIYTLIFVCLYLFIHDTVIIELLLISHLVRIRSFSIPLSCTVHKYYLCSFKITRFVFGGCLVLNHQFQLSLQVQTFLSVLELCGGQVQTNKQTTNKQTNKKNKKTNKTNKQNTQLSKHPAPPLPLTSQYLLIQDPLHGLVHLLLRQLRLRNLLTGRR